MVQNRFLFIKKDHYNKNRVEKKPSTDLRMCQLNWMGRCSEER